MTIASTTKRNDYVGNDNQSVYDYTFKIFTKDDLDVIVADPSGNENSLAVDTHYTVSGAGQPNGGFISLVSGFSWMTPGGKLKSGYKLAIIRKRPLTQNTDIRNQGEFFPEIHEDSFDHFVMVMQQLQEQIDRTIKMKKSSTLSDIVMDDPIIGRFLYANSASQLIWTEITSTSYAGSIRSGIDSNKPASPSVNDIYFALDTRKIYVCESAGTWKQAIGYGFGNDASKPASPLANDVYFALDTRKIYVCESAGTWKQALGYNFGNDSAKPANPLENDVYFAVDTGIVYVCQTAGTWKKISVGGDQLSSLPSTPSAAGRIPRANIPLVLSPIVTALTPGATVNTDASFGDYFTFTANQNFTLANPTNAVDGQRLLWRIKQDSTGGRTMTLGSKFRIAPDLSPIALSTLPNRVDYLGAIYVSADDRFDVIAFVKGIS